MSGKKGMRHYPGDVKLEAVRLFQAGKTHEEITQALGIRDLTRTEKWIRAYREKGEAAFSKSSKTSLVGRPPKKENTKVYIARLEMEVALLKKFHTELRKEQLAPRNIGRSTTTEPSTQ